MQDQGQADELDELGRARRRAFARGATPADVEHLRALEESAEVARRERDTADEATPAATEGVEHPATAGVPAPGDDGDERGEHPARRPWIRPAALGLLGGVLVGILLATVTSPLFGVHGPWGIGIYDAQPGAGEAGPSLAIFDRTPSERDVLGAAGFPQIFGPDSGAPDVRWLADLDGARLCRAGRAGRRVDRLPRRDSRGHGGRIVCDCRRLRGRRNRGHLRGHLRQVGAVRSRTLGAVRARSALNGSVRVVCGLSGGAGAQRAARDAASSPVSTSRACSRSAIDIPSRSTT